VAASRAVVHLVPGNYTVSATIAVPASDIQIIGDGGYSQLVASGLAGAPILKLAGPSQIVLKNFSLNGSAHTADGIEIDNADQTGAFIFGQLIQGGDYTGSVLYSDALNHAVIEMHSMYVNENTTATTNGGIRVVGSGSNSSSQTSIYDSLMTGNYLTYNVSVDGKLLTEDCWCAGEGDNIYSGMAGHNMARIGGSGAFTFSGGFVYRNALPADPTLAVSNFTGTFSFVDVLTNGEIAITGTGTGANNLVFGPVNNYRVGQYGTLVSGSPTITLTAAPSPSIPIGSWIQDFSNAARIPASLATPTTVSSINSVANTIAMSQNANTTVTGGGDFIVYYAAVPFSDTSGSTYGHLNPITLYANSSDGISEQLAESGSSTQTFLTTTLAQLRAAKPRLPQPPTAGVTNIEMYNLAIGFTVNAIHVKP
jgi:hypothetical protein